MKKYFLILLMMALFAFRTVPVRAAEPMEDDKVYGLVNLSINVPGEVVGNVVVTLTNTGTNEDTSIMLQPGNGYKYTFTLELGTYTLKESSVTTTDGFPLGYHVEMDDFTMDLTNPNGDWHWDVEGKVRATVPTSEPKDDPWDDDFWGDDSNDDEGDDPDIFTFKVDDDDPYFPGMTIPEIQEWYTGEVSSFIESGRTDKKLSDFQDSVTAWTSYVANPGDQRQIAKYQVWVENYNVDDTKDFYAVQKKMYDFLKDYSEKHGVSLNFSTWTYDVPVPPAGEPSEEVTVPSSEPSEPSEEVSAPSSEEPSEEIAPSLEDERHSGNKFLDILKSAWLTILVLIVAIVGGIIWRVKYKKSDD